MIDCTKCPVSKCQFHKDTIICGYCIDCNWGFKTKQARTRCPMLSLECECTLEVCKNFPNQQEAL